MSNNEVLREMNNEVLREVNDVNLNEVRNEINETIEINHNYKPKNKKNNKALRESKNKVLRESKTKLKKESNDVNQIKIFNNITEKYQNNIEKNKTTKTKVYNEIVFSEIEKYLNELKEKQLLNFLYNYEFENIIKKHETNIVIESLSYLLSQKHIKIKPMTRLNVYLKYPLLISCLLIKNKFNIILKIIEELLALFEIVPNTDEELFKNTYQNLLNLKKYCEQFDEIIKTNSMINIYNSFYGIDFTHVSIQRRELNEISPNLLIINVGYNLKHPINNYLYLRENYYEGLFLNEQSMEKFKTNLEVVIYPTNKRYNIIKKEKNKLYSIVLNYDGKYYTATDPKYTKEDIDFINNGSLLYGYNKLSYLMYVSELFYKYNDKPNKINSIETKHKELGLPLKQLYDKNVHNTISNWNKYTEIDSKLFDDELDKECFKIYITKLENYVDMKNELEIFKYIQYITNYFITEIDN